MWLRAVVANVNCGLMIGKLSFLPALGILLAFSVSDLQAQDLSEEQVVANWLKTNEGVSRLKLNFTQTQAMKTVKVPIVQRGNLWLDLSSKKFRWEAGQTLVIGNSSNITIQRTGGKKYEKRASGSGGAPGLASLAKGFPKSMSQFKSQYKLLKVTKGMGDYAILAQPTGASAKGVKTFTFKVDSKDFALEGMSLVLKDGSKVSTSFRSVTRNPSIPASTFVPDLKGYTETKFK